MYNFTTDYFPLKLEIQSVKLKFVSSSYAKDLFYLTKNPPGKPLPIGILMALSRTCIVPGDTKIPYKGTGFIFQRCTEVKHQWLFL